MHQNNEKGFTLIEIMIALFISVIVLGTVYDSFQRQQQHFVMQEQVNEMQQNLRAAMSIMAREIRMAGYGGDEAGAGIVAANAGSLQIRMDITGGDTDGMDNDGDGAIDEAGEEVFPDGDCSDANEDITYGFSAADDPDGNGIADRDVVGGQQRGVPDPVVGGAADFRRDTGGGLQSMVEGIHAVGFAYAFDSDADDEKDYIDTDGNGQRDVGENTIWALDTDGDGNWDNLDTNNDGIIDANDLTNPGDTAINGNPTGIAVDLDQIRAVRIWMLARAGRADPGFVDNNTYIIGRQVIRPDGNGGPPNNQFRRRWLETIVECRNMGDSL